MNTMVPSAARSRRITRTSGLTLLPLLLACSATPVPAAVWVLAKGDNPDLPGQNVTVTEDGKIVARFVYGEGQQIPYLAIYDDQERRVTNAGLDRTGQRVGSEPHHRGIFLGWQKIRSDLGVANLWSMREGNRMEVVAIEKLGRAQDSAAITARIEWRASAKDASGSDLLLTERRVMTLSRYGPARVLQVDLATRFTAARDLMLDGDVQHAGVHLRVDHPVATEREKTSYLWSPNVPGVPGKVVSPQLQWGEFIFPLHGRWYRAAQLNAPANPVEEFSTREYGRFGYFFRRDIKQHAALALHYRFLLSGIPEPADSPKRSAAEIATARREMDLAYANFVRDLGR
jgi:hypothetical protein